MVTVATPTDQRIVLHNVDWDTYESLVAANAERGAPRLTFDRGTVELMSPGRDHELSNRNAAFLVRYVVAELGVRFLDVGSMTYKQPIEQRGFEADSSFYIEPSDLAWPGSELDPHLEHPPNLVIEIDVSRSSIPKMDLYARLGVGEVWVWENDEARFFVLAGEHYVAVDRSQVIPVFTPQILTRFLTAARTTDSVDWYRAVKDWVRSL